jgi:hypothetical protein
MTLSPSSFPASLKETLSAWDAFALGRPLWMTLPAYLDWMAGSGFLSKEEAHGIASHYAMLRFADDSASIDEHQVTAWLDALEQAHQRVSAMSDNERALLRESLHKDKPSSQYEPRNASAAVLPTGPERPVESTDDAEDMFASDVDAGLSTQAVPEEAVDDDWKDDEVIQPPQEALVVPKDRVLVRRWQLVAMGILWPLSLVLVLGTGAKYYEPIMHFRYKVGNSIGKHLDFPHYGVPTRYYYVPPQLRQMRYRLRKWHEWWGGHHKMYRVRKWARRLIKRHPKQWHHPKSRVKILDRLADSHFHEDVYGPAIAFYTMALRTAPKSAELHNDYAWLLCTASDRLYRDPAYGLVLAEKAFRLAQKPHIADTLAEAVFLNGEYGRAVVLQRWAVARVKGDDLSEYRKRLRRFERGWKRHLKLYPKAKLPSFAKASRLAVTQPNPRVPSRSPASRPVSR